MVQTPSPLPGIDGGDNDMMWRGNQALGAKLEEHTQMTWKAQLKLDMHAKVGR